MNIHPTLLVLRSYFWFTPALYGVISILFAILTSLLDHYVMFSILTVDLTLAQTLLSTITSSLLTMTTISFSTIMVVLTTYLSQFSPRTMQDFLTDASTQRILGVFIGGFLYSLVLLLLLKGDSADTLYISPVLAVIYSVVCVGYFVFFVHHVGRWIQVSNLIHHITNKTIISINKNYNDQSVDTGDEPWKDWESEEIKLVEPIYIFAPKAGYLLVIELEKLINQSKNDDSIVKIEVGLGDYIDEGTTVLSLWGKRDHLDINHYLSFFHVGEERSTMQDIDFGLTKLVEITLRALSPGTNDPNTAISGIRALAKILTVLAGKNLHRSFYNDDLNNLRVINKQRHFQDYLYKCYYQIRHYGIDDVSVVAAMIDSLQVIAAQNGTKTKKLIWEFSLYIQQGIKRETLLELDRDYLNEKIEQLSIQTKQGHSYRSL